MSANFDIPIIHIFGIFGDSVSHEFTSVCNLNMTDAYFGLRVSRVIFGAATLDTMIS